MLLIDSVSLTANVFISIFNKNCNVFKLYGFMCIVVRNIHFHVKKIFMADKAVYSSSTMGKLSSLSQTTLSQESLTKTMDSGTIKPMKKTCLNTLQGINTFFSWQ